MSPRLLELQAAADAFAAAEKDIERLNQEVLDAQTEMQSRIDSREKAIAARKAADERWKRAARMPEVVSKTPEEDARWKAETE